MNASIDCQVFQDQLESFDAGELSAEGFAQLRTHAESCPDCATLLEMHDRLAPDWLARLEAAVPDDYVTSMWGRVQSEITARESKPRLAVRVRWPGGWLLPALAAASVALLISTGLLLGELSRARAREETIARQLAQHERRLADLELSESRTSMSLRGLGGRRAWERQLGARESVSVSEVRALLASLSPTTTVLKARSLDGLGELPPWLAFGWREALDEIDGSDGVQAGEALRALEKLSLRPDERIPVERLLALTRSGPRSGSS